jgi:hypothetical protein
VVPRALNKLGIPWEWCTRAIGFGLLVYGLGFDHTGERGTIILAGVGFLGLDKVAKSEPSEKKKNGT